jgi:hypothetical protein
MPVTAQTEVYAFAGDRRVAAGPLGSAMPAIWAERNTVLVFDASTARPIDLDLRGGVGEALDRLEAPATKGPGRPKLGVTAREVTLLPRHWEWLAGQPGGASVALRKLVEAAMRDPAQEAKTAREAAYRFMSAMAGNQPGFEEANRALFAGDRRKFEDETKNWPSDVRAFALRLAASGLDGAPASSP